MPRRSEGRDVYERDTYGHYDHVFEEDVEARLRPRPYAPEAPRLREVDRVRTRGRSPPEFLQNSHGRSFSEGPLVRRPRVRDGDYEFIEHEHEHESEHEHKRGGFRPAHQRPRVVERRFSPQPSLPKGVERDEIVVRREKSRPPPPRELEFRRDEFLVRREKEHGPEKRQARGYGRDWEWERERKTERETERGRLERDYRKGSYVRERSHARGDTEDIIVRRDEREGVGGHGREDIRREEIIIRRRDESPSSSGSSSRSPINPPPIRAPPIHQEMITHHRHVDHGYEVVRPRPPQPDAIPRHVDDEIKIRRRREHDGRNYEDEIIIDHESSRHRGRENFPPALSPHRRRADPLYGDRDESELIISHRTSRGAAHDSERHGDLVIMRGHGSGTRGRRDAANIREEAEHYNRLAHEGGHIGEAYNGATKGWSIVDVPPGTKRVDLEGVGGATQEITWQRYNGVRRSKFIVDGDEYTSDRGRTQDPGRIGKRYVGVKDKRDGLWTEITKDLVVKEAIERAGYDYEETQFFYYIFAYLKYDDVANLVDLSENFRQARRERIREIQRERKKIITPPPLPAPAPPPPSVPLLLERPGYEEERIIEHEIFVDADKVPPPLRVRRW
ncbi:hypothetical protein ACJ72_04106 [Emergomyces africanus]|uniref:DUF8035 domain-containing protein n=1 Tax=Emergomyces africanus TaxID=1955775 RepID=A0A1B7NXP8_9EURO|nr:hypothetical protein ACJ72_04106 [Emergomyces africanus]